MRADLGELRIRSPRILLQLRLLLLLLWLLVLATRIRGLPLTKVDCRRQRYPLHWLRGKGFTRIHQRLCGSCSWPIEAAAWTLSRMNAIIAIGAGNSPAIGTIGIVILIVQGETLGGPSSLGLGTKR